MRRERPGLRSFSRTAYRLALREVTGLLISRVGFAFFESQRLFAAAFALRLAKNCDFFRALDSWTMGDMIVGTIGIVNDNEPCQLVRQAVLLLENDFDVYHSSL